jgi:predicted nucleic acid-binding protein
LKILVDSSVWIDHFRSPVEPLVSVLHDGLVVIHPFVIGELALGSLKDRDAVINMLRNMPSIGAAADEEVMEMIEARRLFSRGIGFVDAHLLAAALIDGGTSIWTRDRRLLSVAEELSLSAVAHVGN